MGSQKESMGGARSGDWGSRGGAPAAGGCGGYGCGCGGTTWANFDQPEGDMGSAGNAIVEAEAAPDNYGCAGGGCSAADCGGGYNAATLQAYQTAMAQYGCGGCGGGCGMMDMNMMAMMNAMAANFAANMGGNGMNQQQAMGNMMGCMGQMGGGGDANAMAATQGGGQRPAADMRPGDWRCPACNDHQFARNEVCRRCGEKKPAPGAGGTSFGCIAGGCGQQGNSLGGGFASGGGGFGAGGMQAGGGGGGAGNGNGQVPKPGDWYCPACNDLQFARNTNCRQCRAPKPNTPDGPGGAVRGRSRSPRR